MSDEPIHYLSADSLSALKEERETLKNKTIMEIAKRIDEAKQQGDLSENAEYHQAREDMSWAQGRLREIEQILNNAQVIAKNDVKGVVALGNTVTVDAGGKKREFTIVGAQEANPGKGYISNESPLGGAFLGHKTGDKVEVDVPSGTQIYVIKSIK